MVSPSTHWPPPGFPYAATDVPDVNVDLHASEDYRKAMIPVFVRRAVEKALTRG